MSLRECPAPPTAPGGADEISELVDSALLLRVQEQLRDSEATRQAAILNSLQARIALLDVQGQIISVNQAWRRSAALGLLANSDHGIRCPR